MVVRSALQNVYNVPSENASEIPTKKIKLLDQHDDSDHWSIENLLWAKFRIGQDCKIVQSNIPLRVENRFKLIAVHTFLLHTNSFTI